MARMTLDDFEARYRQHDDPWEYETSPYEHAKYQHTLSACGAGPFRQALELGCSIGVFTALLAPACERLVAIDGSATAIRKARARLGETTHVQLVEGRIPEAIPEREFDLVVASEVLYYLDHVELEATLQTLEHRLRCGARLVAVHWRTPGPERPLTAASAHATLNEQSWLDHVASEPERDYLLDVWERR